MNSYQSKQLETLTMIRQQINMNADLGFRAEFLMKVFYRFSCQERK
jgi:hypothetical protein